MGLEGTLQCSLQDFLQGKCLGPGGGGGDLDDDCDGVDHDDRW